MAVMLAAVLVFWTRQKSPRKPGLQQVRRDRALLENILDAHGRFAVDEAVSRAAHDLNNLLLVLSMEATRLSGARADEAVLRPTIATINQVVEEGRQVADALTAHVADSTESPETCDIARECETIAQFLGGTSDSGPRVENMLIARQNTMSCAQPREFRLLVLELYRLATDFAVANEVSAVISIGNSGGDEVILTVACDTRVEDPGNNARLSRIKRLSERVGGDFRTHTDRNERCAITIGIPVVSAAQLQDLRTENR